MYIETHLNYSRNASNLFEKKSLFVVSTWILRVVFGLLACLTNCFYIILAIYEKSIFKSQKIVAVHAAGCITLGIGLAEAYLLRIVRYQISGVSTPFHCIITNGHPTMYSLGELLTAYSLLFVSIDRLIAIRQTKLLKAVNEASRNYMLIACIILSLIDLICMWISAYLLRTKEISAACYRSAVVGRLYYLLHFSCCILLAYCSLCFYIIGLMQLKSAFKNRLKAANHLIQQQRLNRESLVTKKTFILMGFTVLLQGIPNTLRIYFFFNKSHSWISDIALTINAFALSLYAIYYIVTSNAVKSLKKKVAPTFHKNSVTPQF
ncbi:hypothetical protein T4B_8579 [Trichinella pseudospiralis]|uniref:G-protein coupled receptors family 1 profile domain-containing protein n=2 Tax=Trichinella pseudospiralis TaxID=6337 RepID=A0A0V1JIL8_TRIPS|nr:hypothetical protein T4E_11630 [Trichinella pseudospiralis]KRY70576.1 hypothetical protein T4A_191 [Trichinella pseudospiralis]KRY93807.1 hypothetical protein T4D_11644 [Trichinella pseudospiralis]KRZ34701.1 hypothetical protein T4B_8579 [Trichinella pseudospiralis]KRZ38000.1 hypothetical protein T4C_2655 [Trichinella pseudospiralis]